MPRVSKQRQAAILREQAKKIANQRFKSLPDPLAWAISNPWNGEAELSSMEARLQQAAENNRDFSVDQMRSSPASCLSLPDIKETTLTTAGENFYADDRGLCLAEIQMPASTADNNNTSYKSKNGNLFTAEQTVNPAQTVSPGLRVASEAGDPCDDYNCYWPRQMIYLPIDVTSQKNACAVSDQHVVKNNPSPSRSPAFDWFSTDKVSVVVPQKLEDSNSSTFPVSGQDSKCEVSAAEESLSLIPASKNANFFTTTVNPAQTVPPSPVISCAAAGQRFASDDSNSDDGNDEVSAVMQTVPLSFAGIYHPAEVSVQNTTFASPDLGPSSESSTDDEMIHMPINEENHNQSYEFGITVEEQQDVVGTNENPPGEKQQFVQRFMTTQRTIALSKSKTRIIEIKSSQQQDSDCTCEACRNWQIVDAIIAESRSQTCEEHFNDDAQPELSSEAKAMQEIYEKYTSSKYSGMVPKARRKTVTSDIDKPRSYQRVSAGDMSTISDCEVPKWVGLEGRRIINLDHYTKWLVLTQAVHSQSCCGVLCPVQENIQVMFAVIWFRCNVCDKYFKGSSDKPDHKMNLRYSLSWAILNTGSTYSAVNELFGFLNIPMMTSSTFIKDENSMDAVIDAALEESLDNAIEEEKEAVRKEMAERNEPVEDGQLLESCAELDGSWGLRSNGNRFSSASGCAVIIGERSKKICFIGARNKRCSACTRNAKRKRAKKRIFPHKCYRNYKGSSGGMESSVVNEGFRVAKKKGLKFTTVTTDGDTTTIPKLKNDCDYGEEINHQQCCNHVMKGTNKKFREVKIPKIIAEICIKNLARTSRGMRAAMAHCKKASNGKDVEGLRHDIRYALYHGFNIHTYCRSYFCDGKDSPSDKAALKLVAELQKLGIWSKLEAIVESVVAKAEFLCLNKTSNLAENCFCTLAKFNVGKRVNTMSRGSYQRRVKLAGLFKNDGYTWQYKYMSRFTGEAPGRWFGKMMRERMNTRRNTRNARKNPNYSRKAQEPYDDTVELEYGENAVLAMNEKTSANTFDISKIEGLYKVQQDLTKKFLQSDVTLTQMECYAKGRILTKNVPAIVGSQKKTLQSKCDVMLQNSYSQNILKANKSLLGPVLKFIEDQRKIKLEINRFFIDPCHSYICCAPDGVSSDGHTIMLIQKVLKSKEKSNTSDKHLNEEAQTAMHVCKADKCIVVFVSDKKFVLKDIEKQEDFFAQNIVPKIVLFFEQFVAQKVFNDNWVIKN